LAGLDDAERTLRAFEAVGAEGFDVTIKDEIGGNKTLFSSHTIEELRVRLPELLKQNATRHDSLIIRPRSERVAFIQVDDLSLETRKLFDDVCFLSFKTSPGNYQAWLAVQGISEDERKKLRERILRKLGEQVDRGATGAMRLPGSINRKPSRNGYRVQLHFPLRSSSRILTPGVLEQSGLLAPLPEVTAKPKRVSTPRTSTHPMRFPSYEICLKKYPKKDSKRGDGYDHSPADASFLSTCLEWGIPEDVAKAEWFKVSARAQEELESGGDAYIERTLSFAYGAH
jgi:hypothetical protein